MKSFSDLRKLLGSDRFTHRTLADGSGVLLDVEGMRVLSLDASGAFLLEQIAAGVDDPESLTTRLAESFEVDAAIAANDVRELVERLRRVLLAPEQD
jgi:hypothetical protein